MVHIMWFARVTFAWLIETSEVRSRFVFKIYFQTGRVNQKLLQQMKVYLCYGCRNKIINALLNISVKQQRVVLQMIVNEY